jgi:sensor domain CHASE-containing protein
LDTSVLAEGEARRKADQQLREVVGEELRAQREELLQRLESTAAAVRQVLKQPLDPLGESYSASRFVSQHRRGVQQKTSRWRQRRPDGVGWTGRRARGGKRLCARMCD